MESSKRFLGRLIILIAFTSQFLDGAVASKMEYFYKFFHSLCKRQFCQEVISVKGMNSLFPY